MKLENLGKMGDFLSKISVKNLHDLTELGIS